jgi:hypothetical protein
MLFAENVMTVIQGANKHGQIIDLPMFICAYGFAHSHRLIFVRGMSRAIGARFPVFEN